MNAAELYRQWDFICNWATQRGCDRDTAQDVAQNAVIGAWRGADKFEGRSSLRTWLCGIARHKIQESRRQRALDWRDEDAVIAAQRPGETIEERALDRAEAREVWATLEALPTHYCQALVLRYIEGLPVDDMAQACGVTFKAMESRLTRAREAFRAAYQGEPKEGYGHSHGSRDVGCVHGGGRQRACGIPDQAGD